MVTRNAFFLTLQCGLWTYLLLLDMPFGNEQNRITMNGLDLVDTFLFDLEFLQWAVSLSMHSETFGCVNARGCPAFLTNFCNEKLCHENFVKKIFCHENVSVMKTFFFTKTFVMKIFCHLTFLSQYFCLKNFLSWNCLSWNFVLWKFFCKSFFSPRFFVIKFLVWKLKYFYFI